MGNPRSCSFSIGRGPRSTTWGTWRASTPPSWTSAPEGLHWAEHHRNSWVKRPTETAGPCTMITLGWSRLKDRTSGGQFEFDEVFPTHQEQRRLQTTRTHTLEGEFSSSHIRFLLLLSIMSTFSVEVYPSLSSSTYRTEQNLQKALLAPPDKNHN